MTAVTLPKTEAQGRDWGDLSESDGLIPFSAPNPNEQQTTPAHAGEFYLCQSKVPDTFSSLGDIFIPQSLHKYGYAHSNPIAFTDPSGQFIALAIEAIGQLIRVGIRVTSAAAALGARAVLTFAAQTIARKLAIATAMANFAIFFAALRSRQSYVVFVDTNGVHTVMNEPTAQDFANQLVAFRRTGTRIDTLYIKGHGNSSLVSFNGHIASEQLIALGPAAGNEIYAEGMAGSYRIDADLQSVMAPSGTIILAACFVGFGEDSIGERFSLALPGRMILAARELVWSLPFLKGGLSSYKVFLDGQNLGVDGWSMSPP